MFRPTPELLPAARVTPINEEVATTKPYVVGVAGRKTSLAVQIGLYYKTHGGQIFAREHKP